MKIINYYIIIMCVLLSACTGGKQNSVKGSIDGDTLRMKYAKNLCMVKHDGYTEVSLADPWNEGKELVHYLLSDNPESVDAKAKEGKVVVKTPLQKLLVSTSLHSSLYDEMGKRGAIAGVCDASYINLDFIKAGLKDGKIQDCGSSMQPDLERVIALSPDAIMLSPYQGSSYGKVSEIGVPVIELVDYMETSPLGRAEWMIFFGMLVGEEQKAEAMFNKVEERYNEYKSFAADQTDSQSVMMDKMVQATWYVPGGASTIGQMLSDANCNYTYANVEQSGGVEQSFEQVMAKCSGADVWLFRYNDGDNADFKLSSLLKDNTKYGAFNAFRQGNVYGCQPYDTQFFELTPFHPELLLRDFVIILHPESELAKNEMPRFFKKLN